MLSANLAVVYFFQMSDEEDVQQQLSDWMDTYRLPDGSYRDLEDEEDECAAAGGMVAGGVLLRCCLCLGAWLPGAVNWWSVWCGGLPVPGRLAPLI